MSNYTPEVGALIKAGSMLANCAFNLEQIERLTLRERRSLDESRKAWDEAHSAYAATLRQQAARVDEGMVDAVRADIMEKAANEGHTHIVLKDEWVRAALEAALSAQPAERQGDDGITRTDYQCHNCGTQLAVIRPAAPVGVPDGEVRLWDTQWMNIVNHDNCYRGWDKTDAINHAVKMTEQAIARNVADGKLPPPRLAAAPSAPQGVE